MSHKCLSALGSWGTGAIDSEYKLTGFMSQMPLGIGFMGNAESGGVFLFDELSQMPLGIGFMGNECPSIQINVARSHKCLSALGSWGTAKTKFFLKHRLQASQMPLGIGFMGNYAPKDELEATAKESQMPLGIGFMGNVTQVTAPAKAKAKSQMPLGIGFMGNLHLQMQGNLLLRVTNASRHWVHGELPA